MTLRTLALIVTTAAFSVTACSTAPKEHACHSMYVAPHASIELESPFAQEGRYDITLTVDGVEEKCALTISDIGPSQEAGPVTQAPRTQTALTCKALKVSGITDAGHVAGFKTKGTPARLTLNISRDDKTVATADFDLKYAPVSVKGRQCSTNKYASVKLPVRGH